MLLAARAGKWHIVAPLVGRCRRTKINVNTMIDVAVVEQKPKSLAHDSEVLRGVMCKTKELLRSVRHDKSLHDTIA